MAANGDDILSLARDYRLQLDRLGQEGRTDFVDAARRNEDWPLPQDRYLAGHARKWGHGLRGPDYAQLAYDTKNAPGIQVFAYIHPVWRNRGLAFVDLDADVVVLVDVDENLNRDLFRPVNGARRWLADKTASGTHWRLRDTER